jgi:hypothetical protein
MNKICFLSVAFGHRYIEQQTRMYQSVVAIHPDAAMICWTEAYPEGAKTHKESLYGFKVHAVNVARAAGHDRIVWMDTACILQEPVDYWFSLGLPVLAAKDDNGLDKTIGDKAMAYYGNPDITDMHLVGGSVFVFDFTHPDCEKIFQHWAYAERKGIFGSQAEQSSGQLNRHRHDEACMSMALYQNGYKPLPCDLMRYNQGKESVIVKQHFK